MKIEIGNGSFTVMEGPGTMQTFGVKFCLNRGSKRFSLFTSVYQEVSSRNAETK